MAELVSEVLVPQAGTGDTVAMARGEPGLPKGFTWRGELFEWTRVIDAWKESSREGARAQGDLYLRRHYYKLCMSDDTVWTVYFTRQPASSGSAKARWFLYTIER